MGKNYYIVAIELSSSKISGAVGIETTEGIRILAATSAPVDGFISKGIVRNIDKTGEAINSVVNILDSQLNDVEIKRAYISFAGLSVHSIMSKVSKSFGEYTRITKEIIEDMERENDETFQAPDGYIRMQVDTQEYKFDGNVDYNPIGASTQSIECNYLNIVMKEQLYKQLCDSFAQADIEIIDCMSAARLDADIMLPNELKRNGCALVNIGADTTTVSIYKNGKPKKVTVLPLGSGNITRDITNEHVSPANAEEVKIIRGYNSPSNDNEYIESKTLNSIINARMGEILQNVNYQLEESGERIHHIVFTGGGSKLKNIGLLIEEFLPGFKTEIKPEPQLNIISESGINVDGVITTALYGLLKQGKENCCENIQQVIQQNGNFFTQSEMEGQSTDKSQEELERERVKAREEEKRRKEEEKSRKEEEKRKREEEKKKKREQDKKNRGGWKISSIFQEWFEDLTRDPDEENSEEKDENKEEQEKNSNNE